MNKKGVFFTFIAIMLIVLIVAMVTTKGKYRYTEKSKAISHRIVTMNNFIDDFEKDFDRELFIGGYRALLSMNSYIRDIEEYVTDFDTTFNEILINGTADGTEMTLMEQGSQGASIISWLERINEEGGRSNINVKFTPYYIHAEQFSPWSVKITVKAAINITDVKGVAAWVYNKTFEREFSIVGFEDPLFIVETRDKVTNLINITPSMEFVDDATSNTSILTNHLFQSYYINSTRAPSYLMRFSGNRNASPYGIESMINLIDLDTQGIKIKPKTPVIDFIYFGNITTVNYCNVTNMPSWFIIDNNVTYINIYEIDDLNVTNC